MERAEAVARRANFDDDFLALHAMALERFASLEWPQQSEEEWRRTALNIDFTQFSACASTTAVVGAVQEGVSVYATMDSIANMPDARREVLCALLRERIAQAENRFILWPYLFFCDMVVIDVQSDTEVSEAISLVSEVSGAYGAISPIVCILSHHHARARVVHRMCSTDAECHLCINDSVALAAEEAHVQFVQCYDLNINSYHFSNGHVALHKDSRWRHGVIALGGLLTKARYDTHLQEQGAEAYLDGVYLAYEDQHCDLRTLQIHDAPATNSFALYRGVILDEAHTIYQGLIQVTDKAVGTDAYLTNNNLLLSNEARADSIPSLNISTDEVKCSHGSTTGKVDQLQLFYLQSRGLSEKEALAVLIAGFLEEVIERFPALGGNLVREVIGARTADL